MVLFNQLAEKTKKNFFFLQILDSVAPNTTAGIYDGYLMLNRCSGLYADITSLLKKCVYRNYILHYFVIFCQVELTYNVSYVT